MKINLLALSILSSIGISSTLSASELLLEEVIVTAQKRSVAESAQDTPIALTAYSGDQLDAAFVTSLTDVGRMAPNVQMEEVGSVAGVANFSFRGMGFNSSIPSDEPTVGVFVDGMYLGVNYGAMADTFDLEAIEVLRGPQGTLFGRNVTAGAVSLRTARPSQEFSAKVKATAGNAGRKDLSASVTGGLSDSLAGKISVTSKHHDGYFDNDGPSSDTVGNSRTLIVRPSVLWEINDATDLTLLLEKGETHGSGVPTKSYDNPTYLTQTAFGFTPPRDDRTIAIDTRQENYNEWEQAVVEFNMELGEGVLTSITGYREVESFSRQDADGTDAPLVPGTSFPIGEISVGFNQHQFSEELRYAGNLSESVGFTVGANYFTQGFEFSDARQVFGAGELAYGKMSVETFAIFTEFDIDFAESWRLTLGGRYGQEEKEAYTAPVASCGTVPTVGKPIDNPTCTFSPDLDDYEADWSDFSPKIALTWTPSDDLMVFASATKGFRSGGFNVRDSAAAITDYDAEEVEALEVGVKWDPSDTLRLNATLFNNRYDNLQRTVISGLGNQTTLNAASATINGVELEMISNPLPGLVFSLNVGYLDASYDEFDDGIDPDAAEKFELERAPEWTWNAAASYSHTLADIGDLSYRLSYSFMGERTYNVQNTSTLDDYGLVDASIGWTSMDEYWTLSLFGKNLTDENYASTGVDIRAGGAPIGKYEYAAQPRTYGVEVLYSF